MFGVTYTVSIDMYIALRTVVAGFNYGMTIATYVYSKY